jgi:serine/threonine protein phosphatase PrpC
MGLSDSIQFFPKTDQGRVRDLNEDNFLVDKKLALCIVADGMGGHAAGEVASALAVRLIHQEVKRRQEFVKAYGAGQASRDAAREIHHIMESAVLRACSRIHEEAKSDASKRGMGTTLSSLLVTGSHGFVAHVGDSRIYLYRDGKIQQVTEDHTVYNELIRRGRLTREQIEKVAQKNAVTRAVGVYERVDVDTLMLELLPGDQFLLASDGLHGYVNHTAELEPYFEDEDGEKAVNELIDLANRKGGKDNITCVLVRVGDTAEKDVERARRLTQKREALAGMPLFSKLQERELLRVMQVADVLEFEPGQNVVREGDRGDELYIVVEGTLQILRGEQVLSEVGAGEHFGEMALIRSTPRSATVRAVERSELIALRRSDFFAILRKEYELAVKLLWQFLGVLADRLDQTSRDLSTAKEELAAEDISDSIAEDAEEETEVKAMTPPAGSPADPGNGNAPAPPAPGPADRPGGVALGKTLPSPIAVSEVAQPPYSTRGAMGTLPIIDSETEPKPSGTR